MLRTESWMKINRILKGLIDCEVEFLSAQEISDVDWSTDQLLAAGEKYNDRPAYLIGEAGTSLGFPLFADGEFTGLAVIRGCNGRVQEQLPEELKGLAELLVSVMQRSIAIEQNDESGIYDASSSDSFDQHDTNVIQLRSARYNEVREMLESVHEQNPTIATPVLIESADPLEIHRAAVEAHEASGRWAMLPLEGLAEEVLGDRNELKSLGGATIFIADLAQLSAERQSFVRGYLAIQPSTEMPQNVAGCSDRSRVQASLLKCFEPAQPLNTLALMIPFHVQHLDQDHPTVH